MARDRFPLLSPQEIATCLQECDFAISEAQVSRPTRAAIEPVIAECVHLFMGIDERSLDVEKTLLLYKLAERFFKNIGVSDLLVGDITRPQPRRTQRLLSALVNYIRFREQLSQEFENKAHEAEAVVEAVEAGDARARELMEQIQSFPQTSFDHVRVYNRRLEGRLRAMKQEQLGLTREHEAYRGRKRELAAKAEDVEFLLGEVQEQVEEVKAVLSLDVSVVERVVDDLRGEATAQAQAAATLELRFSRLGRTVDAVQVTKVKVRELVKLAEEVARAKELQEQSHQALVRAEDELGRVRREETDVAEMYSVARKQLDRTRRKAEDTQAQLEQQVKQLAEGLKSAQAELDSSIARQADMREQSEATVERIAGRVRETNTIEEEFVREARAVEARMGELGLVLRRYMDAI
ncbi:uncharacterized protein LODBEIA_P56810 [Lodderomyces beijingensis]|uniref:Kinetochore protein Nuf2 N-terminal domain-containing protein n=1 Tax=Lodderomyces beijingensis TaxID=1775926 RepID=A0ABP0ZTL7_9ASCO